MIDRVLKEGFWTKVNFIVHAIHEIIKKKYQSHIFSVRNLAFTFSQYSSTRRESLDFFPQNDSTKSAIFLLKQEMEFT